MHSQMVSNGNNNNGVSKGKNKYMFPSLKKSLPFKVKERLEKRSVQPTLVKYNTITNEMSAQLKKKYSRNRQCCSLYAVTKTNQNELNDVDDDDDVKEIKNYERYIINNNNSKILLPCKPSKYLSGKKTRVLLNTLPGFFYSKSNEPKSIFNINKKGMFMSSFKSN